ncbi:hypothetical protein ABTN03_19770, partial [Acinetobacter baumannii]
MFIDTKAKADLNIEQLMQSAGIKGFDIKGDYKLNASAKGVYSTRIIVKKDVREKTTCDTVISSIPSFQFQSKLSNGYFKFP